MKILFNCNILGIIALEMVEGKLFYGDIYFMRVCFFNIEFMQNCRSCFKKNYNYEKERVKSEKILYV